MPPQAATPLGSSAGKVSRDASIASGRASSRDSVTSAASSLQGLKAVAPARHRARADQPERLGFSPSLASRPLSQESRASQGTTSSLRRPTPDLGGASTPSESTEEPFRDHAKQFAPPRRPGASGSVADYRDSLVEREQAMRDTLDSKVEALRGAFERSVQLVKGAPSLTGSGQDTPGGKMGRSPSADASMRSVSSCDDASPLAAHENGSGPRPRHEEVHMVLNTMQRRLEEQEVQRRNKHAALSEKWEARFSALEKALNSGLETATVATTSMNERLAKFMGLAEVLEGAVKRVVQSDREIASLSRRMARVEEALARKVAAVEGDVACLAQELANDRSERSSTGGSAIESEGRSSKPSASGGEGGEGHPVLGRNDLERLARELSDERAERLQLALEVQGTRCDMEQLHALVDTANDHLSSLSRELTASSGSGGLPPERRDNWGMQLDALRREIRREAAGRAAGLASGTSSKGHRRSPGAHRMPRSGSSRIERIEEEVEEEQQVPEALDGDTGSDASQASQQRPSTGSPSSNVPRGWGSSGPSPEGL